MFRKLALALVMLSLPQAALAACMVDGCIGVKIKQIYTATTGSVYIDTDGDESVLDCTLLAGVYITLQVPTPSSSNFGNFQAVYSLLLSNFAQNHSVTVRIVNGSSGCVVQYVTADQ